MRAFAAIELDDGLREALSRLARATQAAQPPLRLRWVSPQNQHLTLHFFSEIDPAMAAPIAPALERATSGIAPFELTLAASGCFPSIYKPNVLWVGVSDPGGALKRLQRAVSAELALIGYPAEARGFTPHLTLARVPREAGASTRKALGEWFLKQPPPPPYGMLVRHLHLIQSDLQRGGPVYTPLAAIPLLG
jgi:2'-5' RNA ligase